MINIIKNEILLRKSPCLGRYLWRFTFFKVLNILIPKLLFLKKSHSPELFNIETSGFLLLYFFTEIADLLTALIVAILVRYGHH